MSGLFATLHGAGTLPLDRRRAVDGQRRCAGLLGAATQQWSGMVGFKFFES